MALRVFRDFDDIDPVLWEGLTKTHPSPFSHWTFWKALFTSGSLGKSKGWDPVFFLWEGEDTRILSPWFIRDDSWGDFVFDQGLAQGIQGAGMPYYPKLISMAPFSPTPFYPFFHHAHNQAEVPKVLEAILDWAKKHNIPTVQSNFIPPRHGIPFIQNGFTPWAHQEYLWENPGYKDFEDYLKGLRKNRRRSIFKERKKLADLGYRTEMVRGIDYPGWGKKMQRFYDLTNAQFGPWAAKFLSSSFFEELENLKNPDVYLCLGFAPEDSQNPDAKEPVAMAFFLVKKPWMSGRYWGSVDQQKFLHFEVCYYRPQEWAIAEGISAFDPGMGSHHKAGRGFRSRLGWSLHHFDQPGLQEAFKNIALEWSSSAWREIQYLNKRLPFKGLKEE